MRQVPQYLLIGNGRLARHFQYYFSHLGLFFRTWHRGQDFAQLEVEAHRASHILVLISDKAIEPFVTEYLQNTKAMIIHCSGSLVTDKAYGAHPLMTFGPCLYEMDEYRRIPFVIDEGAPNFNNLLPGLHNPHQRIQATHKAKYHALCVLGGNFSCLLWQKLFAGFTGEFGLEEAIAYPYLQRQMLNLLESPQSALTGPLVRNDQETINRNLDALVEDPFYEVYASFVRCYQKLEARE